MKETPILFSGDMVRAILDGAKAQTRRPLDPTKIKARLPREVRSDSFGLGILQPMPIIAEPGIHKARLYGGGAVALTDTSPSLGVKPVEFHFVCPWADGDTHLGTYGRDDQRWTITPRESSLWVRETWAAYTTPGHEHGECEEVEGAPRDMRSEFMHVHAASVVYAADKANFPDRWRPSIHMPRWASRITLPLVEVRIERVQDITEADARAEGVVDLMGDGTIDGPEVYSIAKGLGCSYEDARAGFGALWAATYGRESWDVNPWVWVLRWEKAEVRK